MSGHTWIAGKYEILGPIGRGGMASVWRAVAHGADGFTKTVALKRILPSYSREPKFARMFVEEARVVSALQHPNIVQVHDFGRDDQNNHYIVMEWIDGVNLAQWVRAHAAATEVTPWPYVAAIGIEVLRALAAAHERTDGDGRPSPVVHRDVSPSNVLIGRNGVVKLADFGLAHAADRLWSTKPGTFKGKLAYLAPERLGGKPASPLSDIYCLGIVLWEALAARRLFGGKSDAEIVMRVKEGNVPHLTSIRADLPPALADAVHQALEPEPAQRFQRARAMLRALASILRVQPEPTDAEPLGRSVAVAMERQATLLNAHLPIDETHADTRPDGTA